MKIRSKSEWFKSATIPACFGEYEVINMRGMAAQIPRQLRQNVQNHGRVACPSRSQVSFPP